MSFGVNSITAWLTQASDGAKSGRDNTVSVTINWLVAVFLAASFQESIVLPDGVIGNTWPFGGHIPGSSPGRVGFWMIDD